MVNKENDFDLRIKWQFKNIRDTFVASFLLFVMLLLIYGNSFDCSWHFDDYINIVENSGIHIKSLSWDEIQKGLYGVLGSKRWQRPLSYFSFALNYYIDGLDVFGYHVVNFSIHYVSAIFLFLFLYNTLSLPRLGGRYVKNAYSIALLSTLFWAINPVQVTAVTYIVQRMASMAAMFYVMAMYFYLKGRVAEGIRKKVIFFVLAFCSGVLSTASKENAVMLPVSIFLYDLFLIQGITYEHIRRNWIWGFLALLSVPLISLLYYNFTDVVGGFELRPFTMLERVLTQPRVIVFYISLLLYPVSSRLMLIHDVSFSKSLFDPWTTVAAIVVILLIMIFAVTISRRRPLIGYCIIFFFLNHLIEGSFLSLGIVYEHRNYLPSMLFFLPLSILIVHCLVEFRLRKWTFAILSLSIAAIVFIFGVTVYIQNDILRDEISLWSDNAVKAPNLNVVHNNLGAAYLTNGRLSDAFMELTHALESGSALDLTARFKTHELLGKYYTLISDEKQALVHINIALEYLSSDADLYNSKAIIMLKKNFPDEAIKLMKKAIDIDPMRGFFHINLGRILLYQNNYDFALKEAQAALTLMSDPGDAYILMADIFTAKMNDVMARHYGKLASTSKTMINKCR